MVAPSRTTSTSLNHSPRRVALRPSVMVGAVRARQYFCVRGRTRGFRSAANPSLLRLTRAPGAGAPRASRGGGTRTTTVSNMSTARLPRNTRVKPVKVGYVIDGPYKDRFEQIAGAAGASAASFLEAVIAHLETELTDRGVPSWWPAPEPKDGELDMPDE